MDTLDCLVVVTGASRGIGRSVSIAFAKDPRIQRLSLCLIARNEAGLIETKAMVEDAVPSDKELETRIHSVDLSDLENLESNMRRVFQEQAAEISNGNSFDRAILINNAGSLGHVGPSMDLPSPKELQATMDLNVTGSVWIASSFAKYFGREHNIRCNVVNMSSLCALKPFNTMAMYCAGKAARDAFHLILGLENQTTKFLKVLNYAPGAIDTDMTVVLEESASLDADLSKFYNSSRQNSTYITPTATAERLLNLLIDDNYNSGDHIDYWDLEEEAK